MLSPMVAHRSLTDAPWACNGDASEMCGGSNRLTVYQYSGSGSIPPTGAGKRGLCYNNNNPNGDATYANLFVGYDEITWVMTTVSHRII